MEELDRIDSHGDASVREKRKEVVKAVEEAFERVVGEAVEKRSSLISITTSAPEEHPKGFDVDKDVTKGVAPAQERVDTPVVVVDITAPEQSTPSHAEQTITAPVDDTLPKSNTPVVAYTIADPPTKSTSTESVVEASTVMITPASVKLASVTKHGPTTSQDQVDAMETVCTFLVSRSGGRDSRSPRLASVPPRPFFFTWEGCMGV